MNVGLLPNTYVRSNKTFICDKTLCLYTLCFNTLLFKHL